MGQSGSTRGKFAKKLKPFMATKWSQRILWVSFIAAIKGYAEVRRVNQRSICLENPLITKLNQENKWLERNFWGERSCRGHSRSSRSQHAKYLTVAKFCQVRRTSEYSAFHCWDPGIQIHTGVNLGHFENIDHQTSNKTSKKLNCLSLHGGYWCHRCSSVL